MAALMIGLSGLPCSVLIELPRALATPEFSTAIVLTSSSGGSADNRRPSSCSKAAIAVGVAAVAALFGLFGLSPCWPRSRCGRPSSPPAPEAAPPCEEVSVPSNGSAAGSRRDSRFAPSATGCNAARRARFEVVPRCKKVTFTATPVDRATKAHTAATRCGVMASPQRAGSADLKDDVQTMSWPE